MTGLRNPKSSLLRHFFRVIFVEHIDLGRFLYPAAVFDFFLNKSVFGRGHHLPKLGKPQKKCVTPLS